MRAIRPSTRSTETRGLPAAFAQPIDIFSQTPAARADRRLDLLLSGVRDSLLGSLFYVEGRRRSPGAARAPAAQHSTAASGAGRSAGTTG